jgi:hypothetical protein
MSDSDWETRVAKAWAAIDEYDEVVFRALIDELVAELPPGSAVGAFERACAWDSTGYSDQAVPLYRYALSVGLTGIRRRRAAIQLSSSLRNIGCQDESIKLLTAELDAESDELDDAVRAVLALCLTDVGRAREAVSLLVVAIAPHLPRYQRSMANYGRKLLEEDPGR